MAVPHDPEALVERLAAAGFVAAEEDAADLVRAAGGDAVRLEALVERRLLGEPIAWITGTTVFCGIEIAVAPGVYVPRWQTEALGERAAELLPAGGVLVDVCTGSGAVPVVVLATHPDAVVIGTDVDEAAVACARANGVDALVGDLFAPVPAELRGRVDLVTGVVPYVPTGALELLPHDTLTFESTRPYDGGPDGLTVLRRVVAETPTWLRAGGTLLLELGGDEAERLEPVLLAHGFTDVIVHEDEDGDVRAIEATFTGRPPKPG
jgi:release factor glutamine methyltransferase